MLDEVSHVSFKSIIVFVCQLFSDGRVQTLCHAFFALAFVARECLPLILYSVVVLNCTAHLVRGHARNRKPATKVDRVT